MSLYCGFPGIPVGCCSARICQLFGETEFWGNLQGVQGGAVTIFWCPQW